MLFWLFIRGIDDQLIYLRHKTDSPSSRKNDPAQHYSGFTRNLLGTYSEPTGNLLRINSVSDKRIIITVIYLLS
jgi:hypothetical protein